jgi:hypothetical protein
MVFALTAKRRHFCLWKGKNRKFPSIKSLPSAFFARGAAPMTQPPDFLVSVAAAGNQDDGKNDQPNPVIVEQIAETVIHDGSSLE